MIGYMHLQRWPQQRAALRMIVIEPEKRHHYFGSLFLALAEKWLKGQGYKSLHVESNPEALAFYLKQGYSPMPFHDPDGYEGGPPDVAVGKLL